MRVVEHPFSDLLRQPNDVIEDLSDGDVVLRRRGAPPLRLTFADRDQDRADAYAMLARTLRNLAVHQPEVLAATIADEFAWTELLPAADREQFVYEFTRAITAAADIDTFTALSQLLTEWKSTAEIHGDPQLVANLAGPLAADGAHVESPAG